MMHEQHTCACCGKPFTPRAMNARFCPPATEQEKKIGRSACNWRWTTEQANKRNGRYRWTRTCTVCLAKFTTRKPDAKYCSTGNDSCEAQAKSAPTTARVLASVIADPTPTQIWAYPRALRLDPCTYCGREAGGIDHIQPTSVGGVDDWTNYAGCCQRCNATKGTLPLLWALRWVPSSREYHDLRREMWHTA